MNQKQLLDFEHTFPNAMNLSDKVAMCRAFLARWGDPRYVEYEKPPVRMTKTAERMIRFADRTDRFLVNTDRKLRVLETLTLLGIYRVKLVAAVLLMETGLTLAMTHPVIFPSPIGMEFGNAIGKGIRKIVEVVV